MINDRKSHFLFWYSDPFAVFLNADNDIYLEPDISVICDKNKLTDEGCKGASDWIIEIVSSSSRSMDYNKKLFRYRAAGVREYWIVDPTKRLIMVFSTPNLKARPEYVNLERMIRKDYKGNIKIVEKQFNEMDIEL